MNPQENAPATGRQLSDVLSSVRSSYSKPLPGYEGQIMSRYQVGVCMDEVYPSIYIGDLGAAKNRDYLKHVGITHVLNTAQGDKMATVNTNADFYKNYGIMYLGLELLDFPSANIAKYFEESANFIDEALKNGGKVLVHCFMGISRSATITTAFLMIKRGMTAKEALIQIKQNRNVFPNEGFLRQLADLDNTLVKQRSHKA
ncbi:UNVERIFIED_CONTAM: hypothetical protein RMT77_001644 [Armadillidium vulgare]|nr:Dual specificity protein phosphatase 3 [Armadillidium vulgare]